jgi:hypothetical protein
MKAFLEEMGKLPEEVAKIDLLQAKADIEEVIKAKKESQKT